MKVKYAGLGLLTLPAVAGCGCAGGEVRPMPNIIIIMADDLGYGDLSSYGAVALQTPNIDRLVEGGVKFTDGYSTSATSTPSRYALLTGSYPWRNPDAKILPGNAPLLIEPGRFTLPSMLKQAGYTTAVIGKWHLGMGAGDPDWNETIYPGPGQIGFDYSCVFPATNDRVPTVYLENQRVVGLDPDDPIQVNYKENFEGEPTALSDPALLRMMWSHGHNNSVTNGIPRIGFMKGGERARWKDEDMADYFAGKVKRFIDDSADRPFFLYYALHQPHVPRVPHPRFAGRSGMGPRGDAILEADWCVGELLSHLESRGLLENTLIIFSSDNGPVLDDGYVDGAVEMLGDHRPAGVLRGGKGSLFEGGTRVPFCTYWKNTIPARRSNAVVSQLDVMASLAALTGIGMPAGSDSSDCLDVFLGLSDEGRADNIMEAQGRLAIRCGDWVMIPPYAGKKISRTMTEYGNFDEAALFNLSDDLPQRFDLAAVHPEKLREMKRIFFDIVGDHYDNPLFRND